MLIIAAMCALLDEAIVISLRAELILGKTETYLHFYYYRNMIGC